MARSDNQYIYPLFIEPYTGPGFSNDSWQREPSPANAAQRSGDRRSPSPEAPTRCILGRLRTAKADNSASRKPNVNSKSTQPLLSQPRAATTPGQGEPSAFAATTRTLRGEPSAFASAALSFRPIDIPRRESLQQRRHNSRSDTASVQGNLTIVSPTTREASDIQPRGRPAGPMIWLPDEQVWLLTDPEVLKAPAASGGVSYPHTTSYGAPWDPRGRRVSPRGDGQPGWQTREDYTPSATRLARSDSSPIRTQFLTLIQPQAASRTQADRTNGLHDQTGTISNPASSPIEEDRIWFAEQQARASQRRDQDRFSPMFQAAITGVDLPLAGGFGPRLSIPESNGSRIGSLRRSSTTSSIIGSAEERLRRKRSDGLRSHITTVGDDRDAAAFAASFPYYSDSPEGSIPRRKSDGEIETPKLQGERKRLTGEDVDSYGWFAGLLAQGISPDCFFNPNENVVSVSSSTAAHGRDRGDKSNVSRLQKQSIPEDREWERSTDSQAEESTTPKMNAVRRWIDDTDIEALVSPKSTVNTKEAFSQQDAALDLISPLSHTAALKPAPLIPKKNAAEKGKPKRFPSVSTVLDRDRTDSLDFNPDISPISSRSPSIS